MSKLSLTPEEKEAALLLAFQVRVAKKIVQIQKAGPSLGGLARITSLQRAICKLLVADEEGAEFHDEQRIFADAVWVKETLGSLVERQHPTPTLFDQD